LRGKCHQEQQSDGGELSKDFHKDFPNKRLKQVNTPDERCKNELAFWCRAGLPIVTSFEQWFRN
jgi:hypothetical protein